MCKYTIKTWLLFVMIVAMVTISCNKENVSEEEDIIDPVINETPDVSKIITRSQREKLAKDCENANKLTYAPDVFSTGLLPGWTPEMMKVEKGIFSQSSGISSITINGYVENTIFWCEVVPGTSGMQLSNCVLAGPKPDTYGSGGAAVRCYSSDIGLSTMIDCLVDGGLWTNPNFNPPGGAWTDDEKFRGNMANSVGIRGGRIILRNVQIKNFQDGVHVNMSWNSDGDDDLLDIQHCLIRDIIYYQGALWPSQPEGTHSDAIQFHRGRNITIKFNYLGKAHNANVMFKQEVDNTEKNLIKNVEIAYNILHNPKGHGYNLNLYLGKAADKKYNFFPHNNISIHNNLFTHEEDKNIIRNIAVESVFHDNQKILLDNKGGWTVIDAASVMNGS